MDRVVHKGVGFRASTQPTQVWFISLIDWLAIDEAEILEQVVIH